jgi:zinc protease
MVLADLGRDPANTYGAFDNGVKYIVRKNSVPPEKVAFYLHIDSGALNETAQQNGLAHFLEHLCFNGSKNYPPGTLIPRMNELGMQFGAHSNAHTNMTETVYKLFMPDNKPETIEMALTIFSDWADGLLLLDEEIDKERGIILEEARSGKGPQERIFDQFRAQILAGSRIAVHDVIGDDDQIKTWKRDSFVDYWNTWYRPENMTLIIVGDIDPVAIIEAARSKVGSFKARAAVRKEPGAQIKPNGKPRAFVFTDKEQVGGFVQIVAIEGKRPPIKTYVDFRKNMIENLGTGMVNRRLQDMVQAGDASFRGAFTGVQPLFNEAVMPSASAFGEPEDWPKMLEQVVIEMTRAIEHGFAADELELVKKAMISAAERQVQMEPTMNNQVWVNRFSGSVGSESPILSAQQGLDLVTRVFGDISLGEIHASFVSNFKDKNFNYVLVAPETKAGFAVPSSDDVLAAAAAAWARKTEPKQREETPDSILAEMPKPGRVTRKIVDKELGITSVEMSNGVVMHHRFMDYKQDQVIASIALTGGTIEETAANRGVSQVASLAEATSRLNSTQVRDLMTGKKVSVGGGPGLDASSIRITGSPEDLEAGFQLAYAMMTDGVIEQASFDNWKKGTLQSLEQMAKTSSGQMRKLQETVLFGSDVRLSTLTEEQIGKLSIEQGQAWLQRMTASSGIEVAIVGDIQLADAVKLATQYVGSLPQRSLGANLDHLRKMPRGNGPFHGNATFDSITPKAMVMAGFIGADEADLADTRKLSLAAMIISDRMIQRLREKEQLVYSIGARHRPGRAIPGMGMMLASAPTDPENADRLADAILEMFADFAKNGPTAEELNVAHKQMANVLKERMKEPVFWHGQLAQLRYRGHKLEDIKALPDVYQTFTAKDLQDVMVKYNTPAKTIRLVVTPSNVPAAQPAGVGG